MLAQGGAKEVVNLYFWVPGGPSGGKNSHLGGGPSRGCAQGPAGLHGAEQGLFGGEQREVVNFYCWVPGGPPGAKNSHPGGQQGP